MENTNKQISAAFAVVAAMAEAIRELGTVPSGTLYAQVMGKLDIHQYESVIKTLVNTGLVEETSAHELRWIGPTLCTK
jgi:DNA-binding ferritin-like protein